MIDILHAVERYAEDNNALTHGRSYAEFMLTLQTLEGGLEQQFHLLRQNLLSRPDTIRVFQRYIERVLPHYQEDPTMPSFKFTATKDFPDIFVDYQEGRAPQFCETNAQITIARTYYDSANGGFNKLHFLLMTLLTQQTPVTEKAPPATLASYDFMLGFAARSDVVGSFSSFEYPFGEDVPRQLIKGKLYRHPHTFTIDIEESTAQAYDRLRPTIGHGILRRPQPTQEVIIKDLLNHFFIDTPQTNTARLPFSRPKTNCFEKFLRPDVFLFDWK